jgi:hypothetical protein
MPGFVGDTFEDTGVLKERENVGLSPGENRHERRRREAIERRVRELGRALAKARGETI